MGAAGVTWRQLNRDQHLNANAGVDCNGDGVQTGVLTHMMQPDSGGTTACRILLAAFATVLKPAVLLLLDSM